MTVCRTQLETVSAPGRPGAVGLGKSVTPVRSRAGGQATMLAGTSTFTAPSSGRRVARGGGANDFVMPSARPHNRLRRSARRPRDGHGQWTPRARAASSEIDSVARVRRHDRLIDGLPDVSRVTRGRSTSPRRRRTCRDVANAVEQARRADPVVATPGCRRSIRPGGALLGRDAWCRSWAAEQRRRIHAGRSGAITSATEVEPETTCTSSSAIPASASCCGAALQRVDLFARPSATPDRSAGRPGAGPGAVKLSSCTAAASPATAKGSARGDTFIVQLPPVRGRGAAAPGRAGARTAVPGSSISCGRRPPEPPSCRSSCRNNGATGVGSENTTPCGPSTAPPPRRRTSPCSTSACRAWTATRWRNALARQPGHHGINLVGVDRLRQELDPASGTGGGLTITWLEPVNTTSWRAVWVDGAGRRR